jgi:hypothetical protein
MHLELRFRDLRPPVILSRSDGLDGDGSVSTECCRVDEKRWVANAPALEASDVSREKRVAADPATPCKRGKMNISNLFYSIAIFRWQKTERVNCEMDSVVNSLCRRVPRLTKTSAPMTREHVGPSNQLPLLVFSVKPNDTLISVGL